MITIDKQQLLPTGAPENALLHQLLRAYQQQQGRLDGLHRMYSRHHAIEGRVRLRGLPNNRLVHDLPGYIVTMAAGYLVGGPISYTAPKGREEAFAPLGQALAAARSDSVDAELAVDAAVYGKGIEICYADGAARPCVAQVDPRSAFVVYDDTVEHQPLLGITLGERQDGSLRRCGERITVYTPWEVIHYQRTGKEQPQEVGREPHFFGGVPLIEYWNNAREEGDFEGVMGLIDAYDSLQSDRVNDKQQFTDSILALYGVGGLGEEEPWEGPPQGEAPGTWPEALGAEGEEGMLGPGQAPSSRMPASQRLRQSKTLFMPGDGAKAEWLTKPLSESDTEVLRRSLKDDIHKLCLVPDLSDESFAGNVSGVAMRFKLLGLEQLTRMKERWFREGLSQRLRRFEAFLGVRGAARMDVGEVQISFRRSLPINELETAQTLQAYQGLVPRQLLLSQVPFLESPEDALALLGQEEP